MNECQLKKIREGAQEDFYTRMFPQVLFIIKKKSETTLNSLEGGEKQINCGLPPGCSIL